MAYKRILSVQSTLLARRFTHSSFTYISRYDRCKKSEELHSSGSKMETFLSQRRSLLNCTFSQTPYGLPGNGMSLRGGISTSSEEANESVASLFEVVIAASDSAFPVASFQYLIDGVHILTGLNWWASTAVTTLLLRGATFPIYISLLRSHNKKLAGEVQEGKVKMIWIHEKLSMDLIRLFLITISFSFSLAVLNMAEKVPSFKTGGILWFRDLSTPDAFDIVRRNPLNASRRNIIMSWIVLLAAFCYLIPSNLAFLCFRHATRDPRVAKALGISRMNSSSTYKGNK